MSTFRLLGFIGLGILFFAGIQTSTAAVSETAGQVNDHSVAGRPVPMDITASHTLDSTLIVWRGGSAGN